MLVMVGLQAKIYSKGKYLPLPFQKCSFYSVGRNARNSFKQEIN